jgi:alpha-L-arabinofuranosidase
MIYGGIYEEGSPLSDADSYRRDVMDAVRRLGVSILRWPGGNFASGYNWKDGIGPKDRRPVRAELAWNALESNRFGTDEFLRYAERIGAFGDDRKVRPVTRSAQVSIDNNGFTYTFPAHSLTILRVGVQ